MGSRLYGLADLVDLSVVPLAGSGHFAVLAYPALEKRRGAFFVSEVKQPFLPMPMPGSQRQSPYGSSSTLALHGA